MKQINILEPALLEQAGRVFASVPSAENETIESFKKRLIEYIESGNDPMYTKGNIIDLIKNFE